MKNRNADNDRNNMIRIQYSTADHSPSSLTIDPMLFSYLNKEMNGNAKKWIKEKAASLREGLIKKAEKLSAEDRLYKFDARGAKKKITVEEFARGKVSAAVRTAAILVVKKPELEGDSVIKMSETDRSNMIRIQYSTAEHVPSSLTIDPTLFNLLDREMNGNAKKWVKIQASDMRANLIKKAEGLEAEGRLYKFDARGDKKKISVDEFARGKVSAAVRKQALKAITKTDLL